LQTGRIQLQRQRTLLQTGRSLLQIRRIQLQKPVSCNNDISTVTNLACESSFDSDAVLLAKAAKIVRREIFEYQNQFNGSFDKDCLKTATPGTLLSLI